MSESLTEQTIEIHWNGNQCALVLEALVQRPFWEVFALIGKLSSPPLSRAAALQVFPLSRREIRLCLEAMRNTPGTECQLLVQDLHGQLQDRGIIGESRG